MNLYFIKDGEDKIKIEFCNNLDLTNFKFQGLICTKSELKDIFPKVYILSENENSKRIIFQKNKLIYDIQLLKSNLQKAIRKKDINTSLKTASIIIKQNVSELLRRLPIIALEDSTIEFEDFTYLLWLLMAESKGYNLSNIDINKLLGIVKKICTSNYRDLLNTEDESLFNNDIFNCKNIKLKNFYISVFLRVEFGTMTCDKIFLKNLANKWFNRYNKNKLEKYYNTISYENIKTDFNFDNFKFEKENKLLNAVDFHCHKTLFDQLRDLSNLYELSNIQIKNCIWFLRSSPNVRNFLIENKKVREFISNYKLEQENNKFIFNKINDNLNIISKDYWIKSTSINNSLLNYIS